MVGQEILGPLKADIGVGNFRAGCWDAKMAVGVGETQRVGAAGLRGAKVV